MQKGREPERKHFKRPKRITSCSLKPRKKKKKGSDRKGRGLGFLASNQKKKEP